MCLLIVLTGIDDEFPVIVAGNRDEERARSAAPPGLFVGQHRRMLSPRDRRAGGTWLAVSEVGLFAGLTNLRGTPVIESARSRGELPHLALDAAGLEGAIGTIESAVAEQVYNGFQLVLSDGRSSCVLVHEGGGGLRRHDAGSGAVVISNEHRPGKLELPGLDSALVPDLTVDQRHASLAPLLLDRGDRSGHPVLKLGGDYGTVSSALIAVHRSDPRRLIWRHAAGSPDQAPYRNYGNLGRRLIDGGP